jgi:hypothetical protein
MDPFENVRANLCLSRKEKMIFDLRVRMGEWDTAADTEPYPQKDYDLQDVIVHPDYRQRLALNDLAALVLQDRVPLTSPHVGTICLPSAGVGHGLEYEAIPDCVVTGWGKDSFCKYESLLLSLKRCRRFSSLDPIKKKAVR